jgi:Mg-chelatase subunit ChlD
LEYDKVKRISSKTHSLSSRHQSTRAGAILPFFAILLPVLLILCAMAINTSHLRLTKTEVNVATDASVHAAGRALSLNQSTQSAIDNALAVAALNTVNGAPFSIPDPDSQLDFGVSDRGSSGEERYSFTEIPRDQIDSGLVTVNSVRLLGDVNTPMLFRGFLDLESVDVQQQSVATQVDRDIALVLDRSGSMYWFYSDTTWYYVFNDLRSRGKITNTERNNANNAIWNTHSQTWNSYLTNNVWNKLYADRNRNTSYNQVYNYVYGWRYWTRSPLHSRWDQLTYGVDAFLDVLDMTPQTELVSLVTFSSGSSLNYSLSSSYDNIRNYVTNVRPIGATAIGQGIQTGIPSIMTASNSRNFAAKSIVVLTDGVNNVNLSPVSVATDMVAQYDITLHTVTFTSGADVEQMEEVATIGHGRHYHSEDGSNLVEIFEEIANNLPTILTQ